MIEELREKMRAESDALLERAGLSLLIMVATVRHPDLPELKDKIILTHRGREELDTVAATRLAGLFEMALGQGFYEDFSDMAQEIDRLQVSEHQLLIEKSLLKTAVKEAAEAIRVAADDTGDAVLKNKFLAFAIQLEAACEQP